LIYNIVKDREIYYKMNNISKYIRYWKKIETMNIIAREAELKMIKAKIVYAERYYKIYCRILDISVRRRERILQTRLPWLLRKKKRLDKLVRLSDRAKSRYTRALNRVA